MNRNRPWIPDQVRHDILLDNSACTEGQKTGFWVEARKDTIPTSFHYLLKEADDSQLTSCAFWDRESNYVSFRARTRNPGANIMKINHVIPCNDQQSNNMSFRAQTRNPGRPSRSLPRKRDSNDVSCTQKRESNDVSFRARTQNPGANIMIIIHAIPRNEQQSNDVSFRALTRNPGNRAGHSHENEIPTMCHARKRENPTTCHSGPRPGIQEPTS